MVDYITFQCNPLNCKIARHFEIGSLPSVNWALFVTVFETLIVYMRLTRNIMACPGIFDRIYFDVFKAMRLLVQIPVISMIEYW